MAVTSRKAIDRHESTMLALRRTTLMTHSAVIRPSTKATFCVRSVRVMATACA